MHLAAPASAPVHAPVAVAPKVTSATPSTPKDIVGDLLPKLPGLPGPKTPGWGLGDLLGPPEDGSIVAKADMAAVLAVQMLRTPELDQWARHLDEKGATGLWFDMLATRDVSKFQHLKDKALLGAALAATAGVTQLAKERYDRKRPFELDPSIQPPIEHPFSDSYPSGHASSAFAAARVVATIDPAMSEAAYDLARQVAASRVYAGVHFPTDVVAGALLGTGMADATLRKAGKQPITEPVAA